MSGKDIAKKEKEGKVYIMEYPMRNGICYDPVEDTEAYKKAMEQIEKELDGCMKGVNGMGKCHIYWS
ncbi:MAG: hypothetical protein ACI8WT_002711, partial [Clostridium sp.]